jgi:hypothetical protein
VSNSAPLILEEGDAREIGYVTDLKRLLQAIDETMPRDSVLYLEGTSIAPDVATFLESRSAKDQREVTPNTLWPKPKVFHVPLAGDNLAQLRNLADNHADPEVADHLVVYRRDDVLLWAHDAGYGYVRVARNLRESIVNALRNALGDRIRNTG